MSQIAVVTDSTSDLPRDICKQYGITVVPLSVSFEGNTYADNGKSIKQDDFYKMMASSDQMPKAAQPTPGDFLKTYHRLLQENEHIISIHISSKLSGTLNSAELARKQLKDAPIHIVDSELVHMPCGFMAMKAADMAKQGLKAAEIIDALSLFRKKIYAYFAPKNLDNLIKGGRISKVKAAFANLLEVKPILTLNGGEVSLHTKAKKWEQAKKELLDAMESHVEKKGKLTVSVGDVASQKEADRLAEVVRQRFSPRALYRVNIGIVVGSHLGIGGLGIAFYQE